MNTIDTVCPFCKVKTRIITTKRRTKVRCDNCSATFWTTKNECNIGGDVCLVETKEPDQIKG